jgi:hypothetical protein
VIQEESVVGETTLTRRPCTLNAPVPQPITSSVETGLQSPE